MQDRLDVLRRAIVEARDEQRISQEELAERAGMSRTALSNLERGLTLDPRRGTLAQIAKVLGWTDAHLTALMRGERPEERRAITPEAIAVARRYLPGAPDDVLEGYARRLAELDRLNDEIHEIEVQYRATQPAPRPTRPPGGRP